MAAYLPIITLGALAIVFVLLSIVASRLMAPERATPAKVRPYESGITDTVSLPERFPIRFYLVAMLFIMFDIEIVFLYPWAVAFDAMGMFALVEMVLFIATIFVAYAYVWRRGGLEWD